MPTLRRLRNVANGRVSGSRASASAPAFVQRSSGAPRCGVPRPTTWRSRADPGVVELRRLVGRRAGDEAAHRVADQRDLRERCGPVPGQLLELVGEDAAVVGDPQSRVEVGVERRPAGVPSQQRAVGDIRVAPGPPGAVPPRAVGLAQPVQEYHHPAGGRSPTSAISCSVERRSGPSWVRRAGPAARAGCRTAIRSPRRPCRVPSTALPRGVSAREAACRGAATAAAAPASAGTARTPRPTLPCTVAAIAS